VHTLYGYYKRNLIDLKIASGTLKPDTRTSASTIVSNKEDGKVVPVMTTSADASDVVSTPGVGNTQRSTWAEIFPHIRYASSTIVLMLVSSILQTLLAWSVPQACLPSGYIGSKLDSGLIWGFTWLISLTFHFLHIFLMTLFGPILYPLLSTFLLITQLVSSGILFPVAIQSAFYKIGLGLPFHYAIRGLRFLFFTTITSTTNLQPFENDAFVLGIWLVGVVFWMWVVVLLKIRKRVLRVSVLERWVGEGWFLGNGGVFVV
jgi:uncharacterized phage infection (PIP) family protein YhgE